MIALSVLRVELFLQVACKSSLLSKETECLENLHVSR